MVRRGRLLGLLEHRRLVCGGFARGSGLSGIWRLGALEPEAEVEVRDLGRRSMHSKASPAWRVVDGRY